MKTDEVRDDLEEVLKLMRETKALQYGDFTLASGVKSSYYFDGRLLTLHPEATYLIGRIIFNLLADTKIDAVGGVAIGGVPMATAIAIVSRLEDKPIPAFIVREERKEHGTRSRIYGHLPRAGRVAIVDDVITTGGSVLKAIEAVEAEGCQVVKVVALLDRQEGGSEELQRRGYNFGALFSSDVSGEVTIDASSVEK